MANDSSKEPKVSSLKDETFQPKNQTHIQDYFKKAGCQEVVKTDEIETRDNNTNKNDNQNLKMPTKSLVDYEIDESSQDDDVDEYQGKTVLKAHSENEIKFSTNKKSKNTVDPQDSGMSLEEGEIRSEEDDKNIDNWATIKKSDPEGSEKTRKSNTREKLHEDNSEKFKDITEKVDIDSKQIYGRSNQTDNDSPKPSRKRKWLSPEKKSENKISTEEKFKNSQFKKSNFSDDDDGYKKRKYSQERRSLGGDTDISFDDNSSPEKSKTPTKSSSHTKHKEKRKEVKYKDSEMHSNFIADYETAKKHFEFFYGMHSPFSQFHPAKFEVDGVTYSCAEQYMMYQKAVLFKDTEIGKQILQETKPLKMKRLGRKVQNFDPHIWGKTCEEIVERGNIAKFSQNPDLKKKLIDSHPKTLAESSPRDCLWGIGLGAKNEKAWNIATWRGKNLLGKVLMKVRKHIMKMK